MKRNPTAKTKTEMFRSGLRHQPLHCRGGRVRNRSRDGSMKTSPVWFRAAPQFDWALEIALGTRAEWSSVDYEPQWGQASCERNELFSEWNCRSNVSANPNALRS